MGCCSEIRLRKDYDFCLGWTLSCSHSLSLPPRAPTLRKTVCRVVSPSVERPTRQGVDLSGQQLVRTWGMPTCVPLEVHLEVYNCKTQNLGLRSKEEKPRDSVNQPSRCNTQEGLLSDVQTGDSDLLGGRAHQTANWVSFYMPKKPILSAYYIRVTKWLVTRLQSNPVGTNFPGFGSNLKQFYWYKQRGLLFKLRRPWAFQLSRGLFTGCILIGRLQVTRWVRGIPPFHGNQNPSPGRLPAPAPAAPHNKTYFSASETNKKNIRHMNYRHR